MGQLAQRAQAYIAATLGGLALTADVPAPAAPGWWVPPSAADQRSSSVQFSGCQLIRRVSAGPPVCEIAEGTHLTLWMDAPPEEQHALHLGGREVNDVERRFVEGGLQYRVRIEPGASELHVTNGGGRRWALGLRPARAFPDLEEADGLRKSGNTRRALELLERALRRGDPEEMNRARALSARIALARGNAEQAARELDQVMREA